MMAQPTPSSSPFAYTYTYEYDVFLSFRGEDTRTGFTGNLYSGLSQRGVLTFIDDDGVQKGEEITPSLLHAIQKSRMAIVIFSKNYASSTFCLNELVQILECYTKQKMWIWPVFYEVDPSEVRHQTGSYGEAFAKHERGRFKDDKVKLQKWRLALNQAADLSGSHFKHGRGEYEHVFIRKIIEVISCKLNRPLLYIANYPVGLEARVKDVHSLIGSKFNDKVNMLGIHGIGGIGKSTIARAVYNLLAYQFEGSCFLANVRERSTRHGLEQIQEKILSELVGERNLRLGDINQGIPILKERLKQKKVLLILDDIDKKEQLQATAGGLDWFGSGSIIIITTRDKHLLDSHGVKKIYEVNKFSDNEAFELFRWNALKNYEVDPSYMEMMKRAIHYAGGLPLALEAIGSNLFGKTLDEWKSALEAYERIPNRDVQEILKVSYDGLEENEKEIFLDIVCFFKGCTVRYVTNMLQARGFHPKYGIGVLEKKSLINIIDNWGSEKYDIIVTVHALIQHMGREIVRQQSVWPEKRRRLWFNEDIIFVLEKNKENDEIEAMMLDMLEEKEVQWNEELFGKMKNLRMLIKRNTCCLVSPKHLPNSLRVLEWWGYPAASLPSNFHSKNLVILNLSHSCFQWDKPLEKSKVLHQLIFTGCEYIRQVPDVSGFPNLTELCVDDCSNLVEIHDSVGFLDNLQSFSAKGCTKLRIIPRGIKLTSLEYLCLRDCSSVVVFPEILGPMEKLEVVDLEGTALENLPLSMQNFKGLKWLNMSRCKMLETNELSNILQMLPNFFHFLKKLELLHSNLTTLPACIEECRFLGNLDLSHSKQLRKIIGLPPSTRLLWTDNCTSLEADFSTLNKAIDSFMSKFCTSLPGQRIPEWFDHSSRGNSLCFWFRKEFPSIIVSAVLGVWDDIERPFFVFFDFFIKIDNFEIYSLYFYDWLETDHIFMFKSFSNTPHWDAVEAFSDNEWHHMEFLFVMRPHPDCSGSIKWTGVYVNREMTGMEDVRFTNPYPPENTWDDSCYSNSDTGNQLMLLYEAPDIQKNIQVQSTTSSSGQVKPELHLETSDTMLPTTIDASLRNQTELTKDDYEEMEAFYASLDAETCVVSSEEAREALKIVQDFISNDASVLLNPELCSAVKTRLEYLSNLSVDDGISREMRILISEASREFTHWSRDYIEASLKIESTASELQRADEIETSLEGNKKKFREVVASEKELLDKLACMEKSKRELEEQINSMKANISAFQSEKNMTLKKKREIFEEGKTFKTQRDGLREKEPRLKHEHGLAKETQTRINSEWSELRKV